MKIIKLGLLILVLLTVAPSFQGKAEAWGGWGFGVGYRGYYGYGYYPFASPYYWGGAPYWGGGFYSPYAAYYSYPGYYYPYFGEVRTEVKPKQANVYVDGAFVGTVDSFNGWWQSLQLEPGNHRVVFRAPGFVPFAVTINVIPGQKVDIKQQMQPGEDAISDSEMQLSESENPSSRPPGQRPPNQNNPYGRSNPYGNNPYGWDQNRNAPPPNAYQQHPPSQQDNNRVTLALKVEPSDATIYIDENYYSTAKVNSSGEIQVLLPQGVHKIDIVRPGYESYSNEVEVNIQSDNRLVVTLQKK